MSKVKHETPEEKPIGAVEVVMLSCRCRCGHEWVTRSREKPRVCPKCKSANWDRPKLWERKVTSE